jgi:hypothetical protein
MLKQCLENIGEGLLHACISSYTKYPEQKWRRSIAKDVDFLNFRRRNTRKLQVWGSADKRIWTLYNLSQLFILFQSSARTRATELNDIVPQNTA